MDVSFNQNSLDDASPPVALWPRGVRAQALKAAGASLARCTRLGLIGARYRLVNSRFLAYPAFHYLNTEEHLVHDM